MNEVFVIQVGSPHLMLADAGADDGIAFCNLVQAFQNVIRLNVVVHDVIERVVFLLLNMADPWREVLLKPRPAARRS
jgi:hypothetical protein